MTISAWISGIGVWSPALTSWTAARARLQAASTGDTAPGDTASDGSASAPRASASAPDRSASPAGVAPASDGKPPPANWLPPNERRRATLGTRLVLSVAQEALMQAGWDAAQVPSVFASSSGSPEITDELCAALASGDTQISPTRFHNSVHNAAAGYYSIAVACRRASTSIGAFDASAATGLLEALAQLGAEAGDDTTDGSARLLFVSFDLPYTGPLADVRPVHEAWGVALALSTARVPSSFARVSLDWHGLKDTPTARHGRGAAANAESFAALEETRCVDATLEAARLGNPTARLLPLLETLAVSRRAQVVLAAGSGFVTLDVTPR